MLHQIKVIVKRNGKRKWITFDADTAEFPDVVQTRGIVDARRRRTFVDVDFAPIAGEADSTVAAEISLGVHARSALLARRYRT